MICIITREVHPLAHGKPGFCSTSKNCKRQPAAIYESDL